MYVAMKLFHVLSSWFCKCLMHGQLVADRFAVDGKVTIAVYCLRVA